MRIAVFTIFLLQSLIHSMGFLKGFNIAEISQLTRSIGKANGLCGFWLDYSWSHFRYDFTYFTCQREFT